MGLPPEEWPRFYMLGFHIKYLRIRRNKGWPDPNHSSAVAQWLVPEVALARWHRRHRPGTLAGRKGCGALRRPGTQAGRCPPGIRDPSVRAPPRRRGEAEFLHV